MGIRKKIEEEDVQNCKTKKKNVKKSLAKQ